GGRRQVARGAAPGRGPGGARGGGRGPPGRGRGVGGGRRCPPTRPTRPPTGRGPRPRPPAATSRRPAATWKPSHGWPRAATTPGACARSWPPRARPESARLELDPGAVVDEQDHVAVVELHHGHRALEAVDVDGAGG